MNTHIDKIYIECLKELDDIDVADLALIEAKAKDRLGAMCKKDRSLQVTVSDDYSKNQRRQIDIFHILHKLYNIYDILLKSPTLLHKFIQCIKNYHSYNNIIKDRELSQLAYIIKLLETSVQKELMLEYFDILLQSGTEEDLALFKDLMAELQ